MRGKGGEVWCKPDVPFPGYRAFFPPTYVHLKYIPGSFWVYLSYRYCGYVPKLSSFMMVYDITNRLSLKWGEMKYPAKTGHVIEASCVAFCLWIELHQGCVQYFYPVARWSHNQIVGDVAQASCHAYFEMLIIAVFVKTCQHIPLGQDAPSPPKAYRLQWLH